MKLVTKQHTTHQQNKHNTTKTIKYRYYSLQNQIVCVHNNKTIQYKLLQKQFIKLIISAENQKFFDRVKRVI